MSSDCPHCRELQERLSLAEERLAALRATLQEEIALPPSLQLTKTERILLAALLARRNIRYETVYQLLYSEKKSPRIDQILKVFIWRLRKKLSPLGVKIETLWGEGYYIPLASKTIIRNLIKKDLDHDNTDNALS